MFGRLVVALTLLLASAGSATAAPAVVELRVEGSATTPFEQSISTDAKRVVQDGESRLCDGTNAGANPDPGPTMTGALDDAAEIADFGWDGTWHASLEDFFIDRIGPDSNSGAAQWGLVLNWHSTERGGCQTRVGAGDELLFAYDVFTKLHLLKLIAPRFAEVGEAFQVKVVDGATGEAIAGAFVEGVPTGQDGLATLSYESAGLRAPKATRVDSVRSNATPICVYEPGTTPCAAPDEQPVPPGQQPPGQQPPDPHPPSAGDPSPSQPPPSEDTGPLEREPPITVITHPRAGARYRTGPTVIRGRVHETGSGIDRTELVLLRRRKGRCSTWSELARRFSRGGCKRPRYFRIANTRRWSYRLPRRLAPARYEIRARSVDKAGNRGRASRVRFSVRSGR